jgi:uncharacterized protein involved in exopolysaccharide biosynthesis
MLVVGFLVAALGLAAFYLVITKPMFSAQAVVLVDPRKPQTTDTDNVLPGIGSDSAAIASQVAVISSRELLMKVFDREGLAEDPEFNKPDLIGELLGTWPNRAMVFDKFAQNVWVEREGLTYVIDVGFNSQDPDKAARVVNAIVSEYIAGQVAEKATANAEVSALLDDRIAELQQDVIHAERAVEEFRATHAIYNSGNGATQLQAQIDQLETQLIGAEEAAREADTRAQQALAAGTSSQALLSLSEVLNSTTAEALRTEYNQRSLELSSQQSVLGPRHPTLRRLQSEVERVEGLMVKEVTRITEELVSARGIANGVVAAIKADLAKLRSEGNEDNVQQIELRQLERNADASRQVLEQFQKRAAETSQFESLQFSDARVVTNATAPLRPVWPKGGLILIVATVLGLVTGCAIALFAGPPGEAVAKAKPVVTRPAVVREPPAPQPPREPRQRFLPMLLRHLAPRPRAAKAAKPARKPMPRPVAAIAAKAKPNGHANGAVAPARGNGSLPPGKPALHINGGARPTANGAAKPVPTHGLARPAPTNSAAKPATPPVNGTAPAKANGSNRPAPEALKAPAPNGTAVAVKAPPATNGPTSPTAQRAAIEAAAAEVKRRRGFADLN